MTKQEKQALIGLAVGLAFLLLPSRAKEQAQKVAMLSPEHMKAKLEAAIKSATK